MVSVFDYASVSQEKDILLSVSVFGMHGVWDRALGGNQEKRRVFYKSKEVRITDYIVNKVASCIEDPQEMIYLAIYKSIAVITIDQIIFIMPGSLGVSFVHHKRQKRQQQILPKSKWAKRS